MFHDHQRPRLQQLPLFAPEHIAIETRSIVTVGQPLAHCSMVAYDWSSGAWIACQVNPYHDAAHIIEWTGHWHAVGLVKAIEAFGPF